MPKTDALTRVRTENAALKLKLSALQADHAALRTDYERLTNHLTTLQAQVEELTTALAAAQARYPRTGSEEDTAPDLRESDGARAAQATAQEARPRAQPRATARDAHPDCGTSSGVLPTVSGPTRAGCMWAVDDRWWTCRPRCPSR